MHKPLVRFMIRWLVSSLGLWVAAALLGSHLTYNNSAGVIIIAGLVLAAINMFLKPIVVLLSLPAVLLSLGFFMIIINGLMVFIVSKIYTSLHVAGFWWATLAGVIIGLVNYLVTTVIEGLGKK